MCLVLSIFLFLFWMSSVFYLFNLLVIVFWLFFLVLVLALDTWDLLLRSSGCFSDSWESFPSESSVSALPSSLACCTFLLVCSSDCVPCLLVINPLCTCHSLLLALSSFCPSSLLLSLRFLNFFWTELNTHFLELLISSFCLSLLLLIFFASSSCTWWLPLSLW